MFEKREDPIRLMRRRLVIVVLLLFIVAAIRGVWGVYQKEEESQALREEAEAQLADLKNREASLRGDIAHLLSDRGIEEVLRGEYEMAKEGEGVIVIVEPNAPPPEQQSSALEWFQRTLKWW